MENEFPAAFLSRMQAQLGTEYEAYLTSLSLPPKKSLRVNTLKITPERLTALLGFTLTPIAASPSSTACEGFFVPESFRPGLDPLHAAGLYYMQEPSAQAPVPLLGVAPGDAVLDLCAAPGGKSGQIAAALAGTGVLVSNEPVPERATVLLRNLERLGVQNAVVTCMDADALCQKLPACFDKVLVDAPCSGEGMFRKDAEARRAWSPQHVAACALRQKGILESASSALRYGGTLVYSTCTFSEEENENVIHAFLAAHPEFSLVCMHRLYPHCSPGEGQFMAKLIKNDTGRARLAPVPPQKCDAFSLFAKQTLTAPPPGVVRLLPDGRVLLLPPMLISGWERLRIKRAGILAGEIRGGCFMPAHALFLALPAAAFCRQLPLASDPLKRYFAGHDIPAPPSFRGYVAVTVSGYPAGFGKAAAGTLKNHYPKGLRQTE